MLPPLAGWVGTPQQPMPPLQVYQGPPFVPLSMLGRNQHLNNPQPVLLVGGNGTGKSTAISIIADAMIEMARSAFQDATQVDQTGSSLFLRPVGASVAKHGASFYATAAFFRHDGHDGQFFEQIGLNQDLGKKVLPIDAASGHIRDLAIPLLPSGQKASEVTPTKNQNFDQNASRKAFGEAIAAYHPASRFEDPSWLQGDAVSRRSIGERRRRFSGRLPQSIFTESELGPVLVWVDRVLSDSRLPVQPDPANHDSFQVAPGFDPGQVRRSYEIRSHLVSILKLVTGDDNANFQHIMRGDAHLMVAAKGASLPLASLSTGEIGLFVIFASLLMRDELRGQAASPQTASGICLIDEIDAHLHVHHQVNVVPQLIRMFPNVQFIMSAHSPLIGLGLSRAHGGNGVMIIEMPSGQETGPEAHSQFADLFAALEQTEAFLARVESVVADLRQSGMPLVLVEGDTDVRYLRLAAQRLGREATLAAVELKAGTADGAGDGALKDLAKAAQKAQRTVALTRPLLCLVDCDMVDDVTPKPFQPVRDGAVWLERMPQPPADRWWGHGIEALLELEKPADLISEYRFVSGGGGFQTKLTLDKTALCSRVEADPGMANFKIFGPVFDLIDQILAAHAQESR